MLRIPLLSSSLFVAGDARNEREEWPALRSGHGPDYVTEDSTALGADFTALGHSISTSVEGAAGAHLQSHVQSLSVGLSGSDHRGRHRRSLAVCD